MGSIAIGNPSLEEGSFVGTWVGRSAGDWVGVFAGVDVAMFTGDVLVGAGSCVVFPPVSSVGVMAAQAVRMIPIAEMIVVNMILCMTYPLFIYQANYQFLLKQFAKFVY